MDIPCAVWNLELDLVVGLLLMKEAKGCEHVSTRMAILCVKIVELIQPESTLAFPDFDGGEI
jgi:hypothetical protein